MSDIFISYAREDRALAEGLAKDLEGWGFRVWWDAELVSSDDFYEVILDALRQAKAAIVIWSKAAAKSRFVRDEARFALHLEKLISTKEPGLDVLDIPFGFQGQHVEDVSNRQQILRAVAKLGIEPTPPMATPGSNDAEWERLKTSDSIDEIVTYLGRDLGKPQRDAALVRLKQLTDQLRRGDVLADRVEERHSDVGRVGVASLLRTSKWQAFLSGLSFRVPKFQLTSQATWSSIGLALALAVLMLGGSVGIIAILSPYVDTQKVYSVMLAVAVVEFSLARLAWANITAMLKQRSFVAATILTLVFVPLVAIGAFAAGGYTAVTLGLVAFASDGYQSFATLLLGGGALTALTLVIWRALSDR